jgi:hypothetical protein
MYKDHKNWSCAIYIQQFFNFGGDFMSQGQPLPRIGDSTRLDSRAFLSESSRKNSREQTQQTPLFLAGDLPRRP